MYGALGEMPQETLVRLRKQIFGLWQCFLVSVVLCVSACLTTEELAKHFADLRRINNLFPHHQVKKSVKIIPPVPIVAARSLSMKMPSNQSSETGLYDYEDSTYFAEGIENNGVEEFNPSPEDDFSEYLWMENEEEFDKEVMQRLEEEALMEQCLEAMLAEETNEQPSNHSNGIDANEEVSSMISNLKLDSPELVKESNLNPLAAEFIPSGSHTPVETGSS